MSGQIAKPLQTEPKLMRKGIYASVGGGRQTDNTLNSQKGNKQYNYSAPEAQAGPIYFLFLCQTATKQNTTLDAKIRRSSSKQGLNICRSGKR